MYLTNKTMNIGRYYEKNTQNKGIYRYQAKW